MKMSRNQRKQRKQRVRDEVAFRGDTGGTSSHQGSPTLLGDTGGDVAVPDKKTEIRAPQDSKSSLGSFAGTVYNLVSKGFTEASKYYIGAYVRNFAATLITTALPASPATPIIATFGSALAGIVTLDVFDGVQGGLRELGVGGHVVANGISAVGLGVLVGTASYSPWLIPAAYTLSYAARAVSLSVQKPALPSTDSPKINQAKRVFADELSGAFANVPSASISGDFAKMALTRAAKDGHTFSPSVQTAADKAFEAVGSDVGRALTVGTVAAATKASVATALGNPNTALSVATDAAVGALRYAVRVGASSGIESAAKGAVVGAAHKVAIAKSEKEVPNGISRG